MTSLWRERVLHTRLSRFDPREDNGRMKTMLDEGIWLTQPDLRFQASPELALWRSATALTQNGLLTWMVCLVCLLATTVATAQTITREYWLGIPGSSLIDLTSATDFPFAPSGSTAPTVFEAPRDWNDNYGTRMRGYVVPPQSGNYTFWISGDDQCGLYLSTDEYEVNKEWIASVDGWTNWRQWDKETNQQSKPIALEAGQRYYIEALQKEGGGGDSLSVGWRLPDGTFERPILGVRLRSYVLGTNPPAILKEPVDAHIEQGKSASFEVKIAGSEPLFCQWMSQGEPIVNQTESELWLPVVALEDNGTRFQCVISNAFGVAISREVTLWVHAELTPPDLASMVPPADSLVRQLSQVEVTFTEPVAGLEAFDLLVNGKQAQSVAGFGAGPYVFAFTQPALGQVRFSWRTNHHIRDLSDSSNLFAGTIWLCYLDPQAPPPNLVINEFLAVNTALTGLQDEDRESQGFIELHNRGESAVHLTGWALTDDASDTAKWVLPEMLLPGGSYQVVFASGKDRRSVGQGLNLHTNFKLNPNGEYLALMNAESPRQVVDALAPAYPAQNLNVSYGRKPDQSWAFWAAPTPGVSNQGLSLDQRIAEVQTSAPRGFYQSPFGLVLSCATPGAEIRYTLDGSEPASQTGLIYRAPVWIDRTIVLRAAAFKEGWLPTRTVTHSYLMNLPAAQRSLAVISLVTDTNHLVGPSGIMGIRGGSYASGRWQPSKAGDYHNPSKHGIAWERPTSVEFLDPQSEDSKQLECGVRVHSSEWFRPRLTPTSKFSFRLYFRGDYGAGKLDYPLFPDCAVDSFDQVVLRREQ